MSPHNMPDSLVSLGHSSFPTELHKFLDYWALVLCLFLCVVYQKSASMRLQRESRGTKLANSLAGNVLSILVSLDCSVNLN